MVVRRLNSWLYVFAIYLSVASYFSKCNGQGSLSVSLPDKFSNEKLPDQDEQQGEKMCDKYLGCYIKIPIDLDPQDPLAIKTEFKITNSLNQDVVIPYEHTTSCDPNHCEVYPYDLELLSKTQFDPNLRTIIISPGYLSSRFTEWQEEIKNSWVDLDKVNVIIVSWTGGNGKFYPWAVANTRTVARQITVLLYYLASLHNSSLRDTSFSEKIYLVGHSLGAHISAFVGNDFAGQVGRITGLDPAGPRFSSLSKQFKLDKSDAQLVDTLHTNGGDLTTKHHYFGLDQPVGHIDIYANNGKHQPNCQTDLFGCSHKVAIEFYQAFLSQHLAMLSNSFNFESRESRSNHRMFAYRSNSYEDFHDGISVATYCPSAEIENVIGNSNQSAINYCMVPVDYVADAKKVRLELEHEYGVNFQLEDFSASKFFFYTNRAIPFLGEHYLVKVRLASPEESNNAEELSKSSDRCDVVMHLSMFDGSGSEIELKDLELNDDTDNKSILAPYLTKNDRNKFLLADLDAENFHLDDLVALQKILREILPLSLHLVSSKTSGQKVADDDKTLNSMLDRFFNLARRQAKRRNHCALNIESVTVEPLTKLRRHMIASYTKSGVNEPYPTVVVSGNAEDYRREAKNLRNNVGNQAELFAPGLYEIELHLDTVLLGPCDASFN